MPKPIRFSDIEGTPSAAPRFADIEEAAQPSTFDSIVSGAKSMVTPSRPDAQAVESKPVTREGLGIDDTELSRRLKAIGYSSLEEFNAAAAVRNQEARLAAIRQNAQSQGLAILGGMNPLRLGTDAPMSSATPEQTNKALDEAEQQNPKTALAAGVLSPNAASAGERIAQAALISAGSAKARGQNPLVGAGVGGGLAAAVEGVVHGGGKLIAPLAKRIAPALADLHVAAARGEPVTDVSPLALHERATVVGEPPTEVLPPNLLHTFEPPDYPTSPGGKAAPGIPTHADRPYFAEQTNVGPLRADEFAPEPGTRKMIPNEPTTDAKLKRIGELSAERPTGEMHPDELLGDRAYNAKNKRLADEVQLGKDILEGKAAPPKNETVGGRPSNATPEQVKFEDALKFLEGDDVGSEKTLTKYLPRDAKAPSKWRDPEVTWIPQRKVPEADAYVGGGAGDDGERAAGRTNPESRYVSGPPVEEPLTPNDIGENFLAAAAESKNMLARDLSWFEKFKKSLSLPENRAGSDIAAAIRGLRGARAMKDIAVERLYPKLEKSIKDLPASERANVKRIIVGLRDRKMTLDDVGKLPAEFRQLFTQAQREQQAMTVELAKNGYFSGAEMKNMKKLLDQGVLHLHRSYQAFLAKKGYRPSEGAMQSAAKFFAEELGLDTMQANARVRAVVKDLVDENAKWNPQTIASAFRDAGLLKQRKLPPQLHGLLGVVNDPSFVVADTAAEMAQLYHQMRVTRAMAAPQLEGKLWAKQWMPGMDERPLWDPSKGIEENRRLFGEMAGKYVAPQLREAMVDLQGSKVRSFVQQVSDAFVGWFALAKVTSSPVTWARNLMSNTFNLTVSGVPMHRWPQLAAKAAQSMRDVSKRTSLREAGVGEWAQMALEDHATPQGRATDWGGSEARRIIEDVIRASPEGMVGVFDKLFRKYNAVRGSMGKVYEVADTLPRLMAYMHHVEDGVKNLGLPMEAARARASHLVNRYFATGASVGPLFRGLSSSGGSPFASWFVDNMRVTKNIMADAAKGQVGPLARAATFSAVPMAMFYGMRQLYGMTDAEVSINERRLKGSWRDRQAFHDWVPVRTKDGSAYAISFDGLNPLAAFLKGPEGSFPKNIAASVFQGLSNSGWAEPFVDHTLARLGVAPAEYQPPILPGQEGYRLANDFYQYMQPTLMRQFTDVARKAQMVPDVLPLRPNEELQGTGEAFFTTFNPLSIEKVGRHTMEGARKQVQGQAGELKDATKKGGKLPSDERDRVQQETQKRKEDLRRRQGSR